MTQPYQEGAATINKPTVIARVLDDNSTQYSKFEYNPYGNVTRAIDPIGRETVMLYASNQVDLLEVRQLLRAPTATNVLSRITYNSLHLPLTVIDAAGQTNSFTYNTQGQIKTVTNPKSETTTLNYNANGYVTNIVGAIAGAITTFTYDSYGRVRTVKDSEGYVLTMDYDNADRVTKVTYPDGTFEQTVYDKLDPVQTRDRLGRWSRTFYDPLRRVTAAQDALGRMTQFEWCSCGSLEKLTDPMGQVTTWIRDLQGRVTDKVYADGTTHQYTYENAAGRLKSMKDARNQFTLYKYFNDNNLREVSYTNAVISTPTVSFTYDTNFNRIATMIDGIGTNTYSYNAISSAPSLGAGMLASIDGPFSNDTISYGYDTLGRVITRAIGSSTNTVAYDALGRVTAVQNALGVFSNSYVNATARLSAMTYPNGQSDVFSYYGVSNDFRLSEIKNINATNGVLSKFSYEYNVEGQITKWTQQADAATPNAYEVKYDLADQLISAALKNTGTGAILKRHVFSYDKSGNRTSEQIDTTVNSASFNNVNELVSLRFGGNGPMRFHGSLNETARVSVSNSTANVAATVSTNNAFEASFNLNAGSNTVSVVATDYSTNSATSNYVVAVSAGVTNTLTYDLNGNLTNQVNGVVNTSYGWDAANRLLSVSSNGTQLVAFTYDGLSRRTRMIQGATTNNFLWCGGPQPCQLRDASGGTVVKEYFPQGERHSTTNLFYTRDHLGSIREVVDSTGTNIVARYDYTPYGVRSLVSGTDVADFGYTGHYFQKQTQLHLTLYRAYDANLGRWLSRDPLEEREGLNMYAYVSGNVINLSDPLGLVDYGQVIQGAGEVIGGTLAVIGAGLAEGESIGTLSPVAIPAFSGGAALIMHGLVEIGAGIEDNPNNTAVQEFLKEMPTNPAQGIAQTLSLNPDITQESLLGIAILMEIKQTEAHGNRKSVE